MYVGCSQMMGIELNAEETKSRMKTNAIIALTLQKNLISCQQEQAPV